jgi:hypothetical protein
MVERRAPLHYRAYLLRCWQELGSNDGALLEWRFSLEDPHTGVRQAFATWEALMRFLSGELWGESISVREPSTKE